MTAADFCRQHGWSVGDFYRSGDGIPRRITAIGREYVLAVRQTGEEYPVVVFSPTAVRVLNFAGDPLPADPQPEAI